MNSDTEYINRGNLPKTIFIVLLLLSIHFWDLKFIPQKHNLENIFTWLVCGFCFLMVEKKSNMHFRNAIFLFIFGLIINAFASYINLDQDPVKSILSYSYYYFILIYFLLHFFKFNRKFIENIIITFAFIYSGLYCIQYLVYPYQIFKHDALTAQGGKQFEILGHGFLMLGYFLMLNRFLLNRQLKSILIAIGFFIVLLLCDFRTLIVGAIIITLLMVLRAVRLNAKDFIIVIFVILLFVGLTQIPLVSGIINKSVTDTEMNFKEGHKYIRLIQLEFFFKRYPQNISYFIMGGGKPSGENLYKFNPSAMGQNYNIVWVDIGLLGFYIVIGAFAVSGLLWYTIKAIFIKLPPDRLYLSFYFLYLFIVSFTNEEIYRNGIFSVHAVALYLIDIALIEKSMNKDKNQAIETGFLANH